MKRIAINCLLIVLLFFVMHATFRMGRDAWNSWQGSVEVEREIGILDAKRKELTDYLSELHTPEAVIREAKRRLNLKEAGEEVLVVVREGIASTTSSTTSASWFSHIGSSLFSLFKNPFKK